MTERPTMTPPLGAAGSRHVPLWEVVPLRTTVDDAGAVTGILAVGGAWAAGPAGGAGLAALLCDSVLGTAAAVHDPEARLATAVLTLDLVAPPPSTGELRATATAGPRRGSYLLTRAALEDDAGAPVGTATAWWALVPRSAAPGPAPGSEPVAHRTGGAADDVDPVPGRALEPGARTHLSSADPCALPVGRSLGLHRLARPEEGSVGFELARIGRLRNRSHTLHGGVAALMACLAGVATLDRDADRARVLSMTCHYLRTAGHGEGPVQVDGRRVRRGRTSAVAEGLVRAEDGRPAMRAVLTMALDALGH